MKKNYFVLLAVTSLLLSGCAQNKTYEASEWEDSEEEVVELTPDEQAAQDITGTWSYTYQDSDGYPVTNTYVFNSDKSLVESIVGVYSNGTLKMESKGVWKVRDNIIEFLYELDECKSYIDGVFNDELTQALRDEDKQENLKVREYKEQGKTYGFPIVRVSDDELVINMQGDEITLTKQ